MNYALINLEFIALFKRLYTKSQKFSFWFFLWTLSLEDMRKNFQLLLSKSPYTQSVHHFISLLIFPISVRSAADSLKIKPVGFIW